MNGPSLLYGVPERMTRRFAATVLGGQAFAVFFGALVARAVAATNGESTAGTFLVVGSVIAVLCILAAGLMRRPWGVTLGWLLQVATLLTALIVPMMLVVGLVFAALWVAALLQGRKMDALTAAWVARDQAGSAERDTGSPERGTGSPERGTGSPEPATGSPEPATGRPESEAGSPAKGGGVQDR